MTMIRYLWTPPVLLAVGVAALLMGAGPAYAQDQSSSDPRADDVVLHEYFNPWDVESSPRPAAGGGDGARPASSEERISPGEPPGLSVNPTDDEVIFGADGPVDMGSAKEPYGPLEPRGQSSQLDDRTDRVDQLNYFANFEPSVIPYKRGVVQNAVGYQSGDYAFMLRSKNNERIGVDQSAARADEDVFWGSFLMRTQAGDLHPLPSVAPTQRILEVQAEPDVQMSFVRDEADNFYVRPDYDGVLRLNIKIAAPKSYFGGPIDRQVSWSQFSTRATPELPRDVATVAAQVLGTLSISREMAPADALEALVEHYRDFQGRELPDAMRGKDLYATLSREQIGVCRHRSLAFMISARALGIPTRYVYNEAHAFVEILWPSTGWRRIDLGGAADELSYTGRSGGSTHDGGQDPLPQPPNFAAEMDRMNTQDMSPRDGGQAGEGADEAGAEAPQDQAPHDASAHGEAADQGDEAGDQQQAAQEELGDQQAADMSEMMDADGDLQELGEPAEQAPEDTREEVIIDVKADAIEVFRGNALGLHGSLFTESGRPLSKREVAVYLGRVGGHSDEGLIELGTLRTDSGGRFNGELSIPDRVSIGRWSVILRFDGDEEYKPASAD